MTRTNLFQLNRTQAVRFSKAVAFPDNVHDVRIIVEGKRRIIVPSNAVWDDFFEEAGIDLPDLQQLQIDIREQF